MQSKPPFHILPLYLLWWTLNLILFTLMLCAMYTMDSSRSDDKRDPLIFPCHQLLFSHFNNVFSWNFSFLSKSFKVTFFAICDGTWDGLKNILKSLTKNFLTWVLASGNQGWQQYAKGAFPHSHLWFSTLVSFQIRSNEVEENMHTNLTNTKYH